MYAIVLSEDGKCYGSTVFGFFCDVPLCGKSAGDWKFRHHLYYLVLDPDKKRLVRQYLLDKKSGKADPTLIITDVEDSDWVYDDEGFLGCAKMLSQFDGKSPETDIPQEVLEQCIAADAAYNYEEYPEVRTQRDVENLLSATMHFHDGGIDRSALGGDGTLYVSFADTWCCTVELWFSQIASFHIGTENGNCWCAGVRILLEDGYVHFMSNNCGEDTYGGDDWEYCHFKAKGLKYHITPIPRAVRKRRKLFGRQSSE